MNQNIRFLNQSDKARIEHDLVLSRIGELQYDIANKLTRLLFMKFQGQPNAKVAVFEGLDATPGTGLSVELSFPASIAQRIGDQLLVAYDINNQSNLKSFTLDTADLTNPRVDSIYMRVNRRLRFNDESVDIINPLNGNITQETRDRDKEIYLQFAVSEGIPDPSPVPVNLSIGDSEYANVIGTVDLSSPIDLSEKYLLYFTVGDGNNFVTVDCRGNNPSATTGTEIVSAINSAGFGNIADLVGNFLRIRDLTGINWNSRLIFKQPKMVMNSGITEILGLSTVPGFSFSYRGENEWCKVCEIFIPSNATSLSPANIRSRFEKDLEWQTEANTLLNYNSYESHRLDSVMDHPPGSVFLFHLAPEVSAFLSSKTTKFEKPYQELYINPIDPGDRRRYSISNALELGLNTEMVSSIGSSLTNPLIEQAFPLSRLDARQEVTSGNYSLLTSLSENTSDKINFTPTTGLLFSGRQQRMGFYLKSIGSGYTNIRIILHDQFDNLLSSASIPIASLSDNGGNGLWNYADLPFVLDENENYHYHIFVEGFTTGSTPVIGANGSGLIAFRELYKPLGGLYGSVSELDVFVPYNQNLERIVPIAVASDDLITVPGTGYASENGFGIMGTSYDLTDLSEFNLANYNDYFIVNLIQGIVKVPSIFASQRLYGTFNMRQTLENVTTKGIFRDIPISERGIAKGNINLEDSLINNESFISTQKIKRYW
jgi:hypothetical protein